MSQHDFVIDNQSFPATRTDLNAAILAVASNSSGATAPTTTYANQFWYDTSTNILYIRNEANDGWVSVITLDASMTATASDLNQLDAITRGSILYGNASGATARLAKGAADTVLTSDGTDISWATISTSTPDISFPDWTSPTNTYSSSGTWSKGSLEDTDLVFFFAVGGGYGAGGGGSNIARAGWSGQGMILFGQAIAFDGCAYVIGSGGAGNTAVGRVAGGNTTVTLSSSNGSTAYSTATNSHSLTTVAPRVTTDFVSGQTNNPYTLIAATYPKTVGGVTYQTNGLADSIATTTLAVVFGPGQGSGLADNITGQYTAGSLGTPQTSLYSGDGGSGNGGNGVYPGGGGASRYSGSGAGGNGANGNLRVYHV